MKHIETIFDASTGETKVVERDFTAEELVEIENEKIKAQKIKEELEKRNAARQAILDRLGLTEEEARLLLGGN